MMGYSGKGSGKNGKNSQHLGDNFYVIYRNTCGLCNISKQGVKVIYEFSQIFRGRQRKKFNLHMIILTQHWLPN